MDELTQRCLITEDWQLSIFCWLSTLESCEVWHRLISYREETWYVNGAKYSKVHSARCQKEYRHG